jgi:hypothetical protein
LRHPGMACCSVVTWRLASWTAGRVLHVDPTRKPRCCKATWCCANESVRR